MKDFDDLAYWDQVAIDRGAAVATIETALRTSPPDGDYLAVVGLITTSTSAARRCRRPSGAISRNGLGITSDPLPPSRPISGSDSRRDGPPTNDNHRGTQR